MSSAIPPAWIKPGTRQFISSGIAVAEALRDAVRLFQMKRVAIVTTNSLAGEGGLAAEVRQVLGDRFHSITADISQHTPCAQVLRVASAIQGADGVVSLGGGSVCDSVKAARLCLANAVTEIERFDRFRTHHMNKEGDTTKPPTLPFVAIPTTLSAAEFTNGAGITDERVPVKRVLQYPDLNPALVILDPAMTRQTPPRLFFATGIRAIDHAIESWCSINANAISSAHSLYAARLLFASLTNVHRDPSDMQARLNCQEGAWLSVLPAISGVKSGASHGLGQALGTVGGMSHGETGCVILPHVLRLNAAVNAERQDELARAIGQGGRRLADIVADLVASLGLPSRLREGRVAESDLDKVAEAALANPLLKSNPRPLVSFTETRELLQRAY